MNVISFIDPPLAYYGGVILNPPLFFVQVNLIVKNVNQPMEFTGVSSGSRNGSLRVLTFRAAVMHSQCLCRPR